MMDEASRHSVAGNLARGKQASAGMGVNDGVRMYLIRRDKNVVALLE
jgi:hypothetical protein